MASASDFEVCVIGAGLLGAATAKYLSASGLRTCLVGPGKVSAELGIFDAWNDISRIAHVLFTDRIWAHLAKKSIDRYRQIEADSVQFFTETGYLVLSNSHSYIKSNADVANQVGAGSSLELYENKAELKDRFQCLRFPAEATVNGVMEKHAGILNPAKLVDAQRQLFNRHGGTFLDDVAVEVKHDPADKIFRVFTRHRRIVKTDKVVVCAGAFLYHNKLLPDPCSLDLCFRPALVARIRLNRGPELDSLLQTPPLTYIPDCDPRNGKSACRSAIYTASPLLYPNDQYYLKIGYLDNTSPFEDRLLHTPDAVNAVYDSSTLSEVKKKSGQELLSIARQFFKGLPPGDDVDVDTCCWVNTPNGRPYIGEVAPGWYVATGDNGFAAKSSDEIGRLMAGLVKTGQWTCSFPTQEDMRPQFLTQLDSGQAPVRQSKDGSAVCWGLT